MSKSTNIANTLDISAAYTKAEREEIAHNIEEYAKLKRVEYSYHNGDDVYVSCTSMTVTRKTWLHSMAREIYRQTSTNRYGLKTRTERKQQVPHRRKTPQGQKVS
tara:strand:- start:149 stop:463 length:315 start_codon:yes stop_codon:yes gene_type:complete